ncbi:flagellar basal body-associated FliL family protein [Anatilimnocola floriformis]|uniref:flagellar basal body-associated FliL family protein n=1 Tax=Anatilimnocola floriformis TaxID=2948575 RepID=UPI0020C1C5A0|nr:flagellar basal body-associated FliL family protein [Anatilimnocola floriformis]
MLKPILVTVLVAVVILTECALAYMLIPSSAEVAAKLDEHGEATAAKTDEHGAKDEHGKKEDAHGKKDDAHGKKDDAHGKKDAHGAAKKDAHAKPAHGGGHDPAGGGKVPAGSGTGGEVEVEMGKFNLMVHETASNVTLRVNFHLVGTVEDADSDEVTRLIEKNQHRLRDQVIFEIRNAQMSDLSEAGLGLIKRRILAKSNDLLGQPLLQNVVFSEFSYLEQ